MKSKVEERKKEDKPPFFRNILQGNTTLKDSRMTETVGKNPWKQSIQCWSCGGDHMNIDFPKIGDKARIVHSVQQNMTVEDMGRSVHRIYASLDNKKAKFQSHMIEVEGKINYQPIAILIDSGATHSYLDPNIVERFKFLRRKIVKPWLVQLATGGGGAKKINEMVKACPMDMNGLCTKVDLNIIPLVSYDFLIGVDWLDEHHVVLDCYNKKFTCLDEEENLRPVQGITRDVTIREVLAFQLKKIYRKGCQVFAVHMEEEPKDRVLSIEDYTVLKEFEDVFKEILGLPLKRDIYFSINMIHGETLVSKNPYRMSTQEIKELQMQLEEILKKGYIFPSVLCWGALVFF
jgi:hypothetical protein